MLDIKNLWVYYGNALVLENINLSVADKGLTAVIGLNGAGKTTLLKAISRTVNPTQGSITFDGRPLLKYGPHKLAQMGITHCPEGRRVFPDGKNVPAPRAAVNEELLPCFPEVQLGGIVSGSIDAQRVRGSPG